MGWCGLHSCGSGYESGVDFIHVAQDTNLQRTPVNMVMNFRVSQRGLIRTEIKF